MKNTERELPPGALHELPCLECAEVPIAMLTPAQAATTVVGLAERGSAADIHLCNAYTLALADRDPSLKQLLRNAALNLPDGQGVVWANKWLHRRISGSYGRVYGPDLLLDIFRIGQEKNIRHYLLGSTPEVLENLKAELGSKFPHALITGAESPPFRTLSHAERQAQLGRIRKSGAQIVWLGLGTPKQDFETAVLAKEVSAVFVAVGAAFDFISGNKPQAPRWIQRHGLEWAFRLCSEPRRLWRRVLWGHPRFVWAVYKGARR